MHPEKWAFSGEGGGGVGAGDSVWRRGFSVSLCSHCASAEGYIPQPPAGTGRPGGGLRQARGGLTVVVSQVSKSRPGAPGTRHAATYCSFDPLCVLAGKCPGLGICWSTALDQWNPLATSKFSADP